MGPFSLFIYFKNHYMGGQMNGVVLIAMEIFLAMVFFHFRKVAYGAIVEEYGVLNWLRLRSVGSFVWPPWLFLKISTCFPLQM